MLTEVSHVPISQMTLVRTLTTPPASKTVIIFKKDIGGPTITVLASAPVQPSLLCGGG